MRSNTLHLDFIDSPQVKVNDNEEACHSDHCLSTQHVREVINHFFHTPSVQVQDDVNVNSVVKDKVVKDDVNVDSLVKEDIEKDDVHVDSLVEEDIKKDDVHVDSFVKEDIEKDDVQFDSVVKDAEQIENETLPRQKFPGKAYLSPYIQPPSTEVKCRKRHREIKLETVKKKSSKLFMGRMELKLNCYHGKRCSDPYSTTCRLKGVKSGELIENSSKIVMSVPITGGTTNIANALSRM
nr:hypothetical protein [Tanacetum cinerariifolium]